MRIAYLSQSYPPMISGAALVVQRLAQGIANAGHEVTVLCASDETRAYKSRSTNIEIVRLRSLRNPLRIEQRFVAWSQAAIAEQLVTFSPDIIHFHDTLSVALSGLRAARRLPHPAVKIITIHQLPWFVSIYLPPLRKSVEAVLWKYATNLFKSFDEVITPSEMIAEIVGVRANRRPKVISNGIDLECFTPDSQFQGEAEIMRRKYQLDPDLPTILFVGRIDPDKQVDLLVRAFAEVLHSVAAQLLIVGSGTCLDKIIEMTKELHIQHLCHFPGFVSSTGDLPGLYRLSAIFCTTSLVEIQSSVVLEAAATGLPVVAFQSSSMPEFVADGESGYLVKPLDITAMADRIVGLLRNLNQAKAMGQVGLRIVRKHSHKHSLDAHLTLYESVLRSPSIGRGS
jgi:1,2-diacylglycerol 3-alpha-glucosyltransferase